VNESCHIGNTKTGVLAATVWLEMPLMGATMQTMTAVRIHEICKCMSHGHCVIYVAGNAADGRYYADHDCCKDS